MSEGQTARRPGVEALKALAHPLRVRIFSDLTSLGPATATTLAERLGESSGSTSYHLRQLEKHGFVREDPERGNARDRWWERVPGPIELGSESDSAPDAQAASAVLETEFARIENQRFADSVARRGELSPEWAWSVQTGSASLRLTAAELDELGREVWALIGRWRERPDSEDARRVDVQFRGFPVVPDGEASP